MARLAPAMFGASIVRQKREKERKERLARGDPPIIPFIKPFPPRFDPNQLPYFKYRQTLAVLGRQREQRQVTNDKVGLRRKLPTIT